MTEKKPQIDKFKEAAKEHGCDESEKAFADKLRKIAKPESKDIQK